MFNEIYLGDDPTANEPVHLQSAPCPAGQVQDYDPETRTFLPGCVDETPAYKAFGFPTGGPVATVKGLAVDTTWIWLAGGILVALALLTGSGRRR